MQAARVVTEVGEASWSVVTAKGAPVRAAMSSESNQ